MCEPVTFALKRYGKMIVLQLHQVSGSRKRFDKQCSLFAAKEGAKWRWRTFEFHPFLWVSFFFLQKRIELNDKRKEHRDFDHQNIFQHCIDFVVVNFCSEWSPHKGLFLVFFLYKTKAFLPASKCNINNYIKLTQPRCKRKTEHSPCCDAFPTAVGHEELDTVQSVSGTTDHGIVCIFVSYQSCPSTAAQEQRIRRRCRSPHPWEQRPHLENLILRHNRIGSCNTWQSKHFVCDFTRK